MAARHAVQTRTDRSTRPSAGGHHMIPAPGCHGQGLVPVEQPAVSQYDAGRRRGFSLTIKSTAGGYSSHGDDRHVYFGIDNGRQPAWEDGGRTSPTSNYVNIGCNRKAARIGRAAESCPQGRKDNNA